MEKQNYRHNKSQLLVTDRRQTDIYLKFEVDIVKNKEVIETKQFFIS
jgi:hypothetical protein